MARVVSSFAINTTYTPLRLILFSFLAQLIIAQRVGTNIYMYGQSSELFCYQHTITKLLLGTFEWFVTEISTQYLI